MNEVAREDGSMGERFRKQHITDEELVHADQDAALAEVEARRLSGELDDTQAEKERAEVLFKHANEHPPLDELELGPKQPDANDDLASS